jgi:hypothetical protein
LPVSTDIRQSNLEKPGRDLHGNVVERNSRRRFGSLQQYAGYVDNAAMNKVTRQRDDDLDGVTGPKRPIIVARNRQFYGHLEIRNFNIRSYDEFRQLISGNNLVSMPNDRTNKPLLYRVLPAYFVKHRLERPSWFTHIPALRRVRGKRPISTDLLHR